MLRMMSMYLIMEALVLVLHQEETIHQVPCYVVCVYCGVVLCYVICLCVCLLCDGVCVMLCDGV